MTGRGRGIPVIVISNDREVTKYIFSQIVLERRAIEGDSPVDEKNVPSFECPEYYGARGIP